MYLPLVSSHDNQLQPKMSEGIWLGIVERTQETIVGTERGIVKCRTVKRFPEEQRWDGQLAMKIQGVPWAIVNGVKGDYIPVAISEQGIPTTPAQDADDMEPMVQREEDVSMPKRSDRVSGHTPA